MTTDPIADLLTRIRNAVQRGYNSTSAPFSKVKQGVLGIMEKEGFIDGYEVQESVDKKKYLNIKIRYIRGKSMISELNRISKPGVRMYVGYREIPKVKRGLGIAILSTPKGILSGNTAKRLKVGGELICTIS